MIKSILAVGVSAASLLTGSAAIAGPYVDASTEINTSGGEAVDQTYVAVGGYEVELSETISAYAEAGGGVGALGEQDSEGVIRVAAGLNADVTENIDFNVRYEYTQFTDSDIDTNRYSANIRYTF